MAQSIDEQKKQYPLPVYNYRVRIGSEIISFQSVSGLSIQYETATYRHGLSWQEGDLHVPVRSQPLNISLQKGLVRDGGVLLEWISLIRTDRLIKRDVFIDLCDEKGAASITWRVIDCFPIKLDAPSFEADRNEVAIETLELMAGALQITYHQSGRSGGSAGRGFVSSDG